MREYTEPEVVPEPDPGTNMTSAMTRHARATPDAVLFSRRDANGWKPVTAHEFASHVTAISKGLIATGVEPGDRVALMSSTRYEWTLLDYAIWTAGGVTVPIYETSAPEQIRWILSDSGAKAVFLETTEHVKRCELAGDLPELTHRWQIDGTDQPDLRALEDAGTGVADETVEQRRRSRTIDDLATLVYTSGTTGRPKGCALTHKNLWSTSVCAARVLPELFSDRGSTLLFLPLAHIFGRLIQNACLENGVHLAHTTSTNLAHDLGTFQPTFLLAVPRVFEKVFNTYRQTAQTSGKGGLFDRAAKVAIEYSVALDGGGPGLALKLKHALFERLLYGPKLRAPLGGRLTHVVSGGAPLGARLGHFYRGIGITICEGYGLTETSAGSAVNTPQHLKIGTVGRPSPGYTVRIAEPDDEVLVRGPGIFAGYWHDDGATSEALDRDGWLHTGDVGALDEEGFLRITGRKKEVLITAGGKNVAPAPLEDRIRAHPLVSQAMVIGDNRKFIAALITVDEDALQSWAASRPGLGGLPVETLRDDPAVRAEIQHAIDEANASVSQAEGVRTFVILPADFTEADGTLTPSMKVRRAIVTERYASAIDAIYRD